MRVKRTIACALLVVALGAGATGCATDPETEVEVAGEPVIDVAPAAVEGLLTGDTLPTEPGYAWEIALYEGTEPIPVQMSVAGPWTLPAADGWAVSATEIVETASTPGIEQFEGVEFVEKTVSGGLESYFPRQVTDEWLLQLGSITVGETGPTAQTYTEPLRVWPLGFDVGDEFIVLDGENFRIEADVLAQNTVTVPAGVIEDAYLLRFEFVPITAGAISGIQYYILAPGVGFVAQFGVSAGDEATGFNALDSARVLTTLPSKQ